MKPIFWKPVIIVPLLLLAACAGTAGSIPGTSDQGYAGTTDVHATFILVPEGQKIAPSELRWIDAKDKDNLSFKMNPATGEVSYTVGKSTGAAQVKARADLEAIIAGKNVEALEKAMPGITDIIKSVIPLLVP